MDNLANVNIQINQGELKKQVKTALEEHLRTLMLTWDINEISRQTCMSKSFLEKEILHDPRMKMLERRKEKGKRLWLYEQSKQAILEIMDEW